MASSSPSRPPPPFAAQNPTTVPGSLAAPFANMEISRAAAPPFAGGAPPPGNGLAPPSAIRAPQGAPPSGSRPFPGSPPPPSQPPPPFTRPGAPLQESPPRFGGPPPAMTSQPQPQLQRPAFGGPPPQVQRAPFGGPPPGALQQPPPFGGPPAAAASRPARFGGPPLAASQPQPPVGVPQGSLFGGPPPAASAQQPPIGGGSFTSAQAPLFGGPPGSMSQAAPAAGLRPPFGGPPAPSQQVQFGAPPPGPSAVRPGAQPLPFGASQSQAPPFGSTQAPPFGSTQAPPFMGTTGGNAPTFAPPMWQGQARPGAVSGGMQPSMRMPGAMLPNALGQGMSPASAPTMPYSPHAQVSTPSKIDPNQIPRPIPETSVIIFETRQGGQAAVPPAASSEFIVKDTGNCNPRMMRCTMNQIPCTGDLLTTSGMPLALLVQPFALPHPSEEPLQLVDFGEMGPIRCSRCKAYINPFMRFIDQGKHFICNLCGFSNDTPREYFCNLGPDGRRRDADERPELCRGSVEFVATKEFLVRDDWASGDARGFAGPFARDERPPGKSRISPMRGSMSYYHDDHAEEMEDDYDYDMDDPVDDIVDEHQDRGFMDFDSDDDNYAHSNDDIPDTSSADARKGKDMQGILWERLPVTREKYRQTRLEQYKNYENVPNSGEEAIKDCKPTEKGGMYYEFRQNTRSVKSTILHFQLRNLVWATSKHDVYFTSSYSIRHWSALSGMDSEIINVEGHVAPREKCSGSLSEGFSQTQVSTLAVKDNLLIAGGFQGELICKHLDREGISFCCRTTYDDNAITNAIEIFNTSSGAVHFIASNNDSGVRDYDMERFRLCKYFQFEWPVNHTSLSPDGKVVVIVGDDPDGLLIDANSGKTLHSIKGHRDFSFASAWSPDGRTFATGNQDKTCRIWDTRNLSKAIHVLRGNLGAIRSIRFTSDGQFMSMAEPADFVHVYDVKSDYNRRQELDFFGEISGTSFSPDTDMLFVGVWDRTYGSLLQFGRLHNYSYLDSLF